MMNYKGLIYIVFFIIFSSLTFSQTDKYSITPSVYYTYGDYSNDNYSKSYSAYGKIVIDRLDYVVLGYDDLLIHNRDWEYEQQTYLVGGLKNYYPYYFKANYLYIKGDFNYQPIPIFFDYGDETHLLNAEAIYNYKFFFIGASFSYLTLDGATSVNSNQFGLSFLWRIQQNLGISIEPYYVSVSDERNLFSALLKVDYSPIKNLKLILKASGGERAYFFNTDLLTIFNQNETQKNYGSVRVEYSPFKNFDIIGTYQYSEFSTYNIDYMIAGIKYFIGL